MCKKNKRLIAAFISITSTIFLSILSAAPAQAAPTFTPDMDYLFTKTLINNLGYNCRSEMNNTVTAQDYFDNGFEKSVLRDGASGEVILPSLDSGYNHVNENSAGARAVSCKALFLGDKLGTGSSGTMTGLFDIYNISPPPAKNENTTNIVSITEFMQDRLGYAVRVDGESLEEYCYVIKYGPDNLIGGNELTRACIDSRNWTWNPDGTYGANSDFEFQPRVKVTAGYDVSIDTKNDGMVEIKIMDGNTDTYCFPGVDITGILPENNSPGLCYVVLKFDSRNISPSRWNEGATTQGIITNRNNVKTKFTLEFEGGVPEDGATPTSTKENTRFVKGDPDDIVSAVASTNPVFTKWERFSNLEKYSLYMQYLGSFLGVSDIASGNCQEARPETLASDSEQKYYVYAKGQGWCEISSTVTGSKVFDSGSSPIAYNMAVVDEDDMLLVVRSLTLEKLINNYLANLDYESLEEELEDWVTANASSDNTSGGNNACYTGGGAISWILCPVVEGLGQLLNQVYAWIEVNFLQLPANTFFNSVDSQGQENKNSLYTYWSRFRDFANIVFIILILIVIFSQLTGYGIDNYGIKRMLPRIIAAAILVNLSFLICQIAVDLSNIIGISLKGLLAPQSFDNSYATGVDGSIYGGSGSDGSGAVAAIGVLGISFAIGSIFMNPAIIITFLLTLLSAAISVLMVFITLLSLPRLYER